MKNLLFSMLIFCSYSNAAEFNDLISELQSDQISLQTIALLAQLDRDDAINELRLGYGICMAANRGGCSTTGTLGYGLCMAANRGGCSTSGSLGYGICMVANRGGCSTNGSLGYGICMASNRGGCSTN